LYGGQIVAQALYAAALTVEPTFGVHSLRAYFIRRGDHGEPVRYEVDRIRNGRSFCTRRVVARQAVGAILNLEASFQVHEDSAEIQISDLPPGVPSPDGLPADSWSPVFDRRFVPAEVLDEAGGRQGGRVAAWMRVLEPLDTPLANACGLAYLSDDLPTDAVVRTHPIGQLEEAERWEGIFSASLDHAIWFHRPAPADAWNLHDFSCVSYGSGRGLTIGKVYSQQGVHVATVAQEVLLRDTRT
jgi:acyl-CoA thioesterase-2